MSESKYATLLQNLGFTKRKKPPQDWDPSPPRTPIKNSKTNPPPTLEKRPAAAVAMPGLPWFIHMNGDTIVMDETKQAWELEGQEVNLSDSGFNKVRI